MKNIIIILFLTLLQFNLSAQYSQKKDQNFDRFRWNSSGYFKTDEYKLSPDKKLLDWKNYNSTWDGKQFAIWSVFAISGIAHGMREAYHADPYVFETQWKVLEKSFWGSDAWIRNYNGNDVDLGHKPEWFGNIGRDFWHTADEVDVWGLSLACTLNGMRNQPKKYRWANLLAGMGIRTVCAFVTYNTLRS